MKILIVEDEQDLRETISSDMQISVSAYDKDTAKLEALSAFGVKPCKSECELVKKCDYICLLYTSVWQRIQAHSLSQQMTLIMSKKRTAMYSVC